MSKLFQCPVLFLVFNRIDTTKQVFNELKKIKPQYLFIASDGGRLHVPGEVEIVTEIRKQILKEIDWPCEIKTLFREENLGCGKAVSSAITWFFQNVEQGIILEDDCQPLPGFFEFCSEMLIYYKNDTSVYEISGSNLQAGKYRGNGSYYFSNYVGIWGWATWARAWNKYDYEMKTFEKFVNEKRIEKIFSAKKQQKFWTKILEKATTIDTWDYQWVYTVWSNNGLSIIPNRNLIKNIGFNGLGTHVLAEPKWYKKLTAGNNNISPIVHPLQKAISKEADDFYFANTSQSSFFKKVWNFILRKINA